MDLVSPPGKVYQCARCQEVYGHDRGYLHSMTCSKLLRPGRVVKASVLDEAQGWLT